MEWQAVLLEAVQGVQSSEQHVGKGTGKNETGDVALRAQPLAKIDVMISVLSTLSPPYVQQRREGRFFNQAVWLETPERLR